jgi:hypothetical protein
MVIESRCIVLDLVAFYSKAVDAFPAEELELLEIDMSNVEKAGSTTKLTVSSSYSKAIL